MTYNWGSEAEKTARAEDIPVSPPEGVELHIVRVLHTNRDGVQFRSQYNDTKMLVVYGDEEGREAAEFITLSNAAGWTLAKLLSAAGVNLAKMEAAGIGPQSFEDPAFAASFLIPQGRGLTFRGRVTWKTGKNGKSYASVEPIRRAPQAPGSAGSASSDVPKGDIPF